MKYSKVALLAFLILACATIVTKVNSASSLSMTIKATACLTPTDTTRVNISWNPVNDRRGDPVARYVWELQRNNARIAGDTTLNTSVIYPLLCPQYGDSIVLAANVFAIDVRGNAGVKGVSNNLVIKTTDPGPTAPVITIDTLAVQLDSIVVYAFGNDTITQKYLATGIIPVGVSIQFCPLLFPTGGTPGVPLEYLDICTMPVPNENNLVYRRVETVYFGD